MTQISRRDAIKFSAVSALGGVALGAALPAIGPQSDVAKCIEAHKAAMIELEPSNVKMDRAEKAFKKMRHNFDRMTLSARCMETKTLRISPGLRDENRVAIANYYKAARGVEALINGADIEADNSEAEALRILAEKEKAFDDAKIVSGETEAFEMQRTVYRQEDKALVALLASQPETPEEAALKGEYLRSTWWVQEAQGGAFDVEQRHFEAMFQGMGCGAL